MSDPDDHDDDVGECSLPFSNVTMACTVDCEVLGKADPPLFELIDNNVSVDAEGYCCFTEYT